MTENNKNRATVVMKQCHKSCYRLVRETFAAHVHCNFVIFASTKVQTKIITGNNGCNSVELQLGKE